MKKITIGRGRECDIRLSDSTDKVSRRQAVITVSPSGKMFIYDTSANGTYVNGEKVVKPEPLPVRRGDNVNFAHTVDLDWSQVKNPYRRMWGMLIAFIVAVIVIAGICIIWGEALFSEKKVQEAETEKVDADSVAPTNDSLKLETPTSNAPAAPVHQTVPQTKPAKGQAAPSTPKATTPGTPSTKPAPAVPGMNDPSVKGPTAKPEPKAPETDHKLLEEMTKEKN